MKPLSTSQISKLTDKQFADLLKKLMQDKRLKKELHDWIIKETT